PPPGQGNAFPGEVAIRSPQFELDTPVRVVMRALASSAPGYLRGNVYRGFNGSYGGVWVADEKDPTDVVEITRDEDRNLTVLTFLLQNTGDVDTERLEFRFASDFRNVVTPLPANATSVTLDAKSAAITRDGGLIAENWVPSTGVIVTVNKPDPAAAYQEPLAEVMAPGQDVRQEYLRLPPLLTDQLAVLTDEIFDGRNPGDLSPQARIVAVVRFFSDNFTYSLKRDDYVPSRGEYYSPLMRFLFYRRTGHCELFATSAALLLRLYGVPTRYVAGVVCTRYNQAGYYYATNFDLHAWAEAWVDDEQKWVLVEATPPGTEIDDILADFEADSWGRSFRDYIAFKYENMVYWFRRGYLAQVIIHAWDAVYGWTLYQFRDHPVRSVFGLLVPLALAAAGATYLRNIRRKRYALTRQARRLARMMRSLQLAVWRKTGVQREPWQTYGAWAAELDDPALNTCVALYERIRYSGTVPTPEDVESFEQAVRAVRNHIPRRNDA
ncbi:MAG: transglutaminase domain-containing protein, partial [Lentisphaeria bacterium]|nr:transglutaminase domain-containing protein [Lentisphaeria bacterium]